MPAIIAEIEEIVEFDDLIARAMADIDDVNMLSDGQDPRERQSIDIYNFCLFLVLTNLSVIQPDDTSNLDDHDDNDDHDDFVDLDDFDVILNQDNLFAGVFRRPT